MEQAKLTAADAAQSDRFGHSVALSGDTIVVGAPLHDTDRGADTGAAYIFLPEGDTWKQEAETDNQERAESRPTRLWCRHKRNSRCIRH